MQLHRARHQFDEAGVGLILIGQATPRDAAEFRRGQGVDLRILADERLLSYNAIRGQGGSLSDLVGPKVVAKGMLTTLTTGKVQGRTVGKPAQLGAAAVIVPSGEVVWK